MSGPTPEPLTTLARMEMLDNRLRQMTRIGVGALVIIAILLALLIAGRFTTGGGAGQANEYYVRDEKGTRRAWLGMAQGTPALEFYGEDGKVVAGFVVAKDDTALLFKDDQQKVRARFGLTKGEPGLILFGKDGKQRVAVGDVRDEPTLILRDEQDKPRAILVVTKGGSEVRFLDDQGRARAVLGAGSKGPALRLLDENGKEVFAKP